MKLLLALAVASAACSKSTPPAAPASDEPTTATGSAAPAWTAGHFEGQSVGGRGGTYWYDLCPDGSYAFNCLDAICDRGTWRRDGDAIVLSSSSPDRPGQVTRVAIGADGASFGTAEDNGPFVGTGEPTTCP